MLSHKRKTIYGIIAIFIVIGAGIIGVQRFKYSSKSQLLVVQEYNRTIDAYTASKSNEYLSSVLASVVKSNSFYTKVMEAGFDINQGYFGQSAKDQMKEWDRTVNAKSINDSGIIAITVYHPDRSQAEKIDRAINYVLMTQNTAYHGSGDAVKVRLIDQPITSTLPVKPNILLILGLAIVIGFAVGLMYVYLLPQSSVAPHRYGQHAPFVQNPVAPVFRHQEMTAHYEQNEQPAGQPEIGFAPEQGGYWEGDSPVTPEEIQRRGSIKNILR